MERTRQSRDRGNRNRSSEASKLSKAQKKKRRAEPQRFQRHATYGKIPLIRRTYENSLGGGSYETWEYDPNYRPEMPKGAIRGNVLQQQFCPMCHVPRYFYVDQHKTCVQCGLPFVFSAAEQKYWFETLHFYIDSVAVRCRSCRRRRRTQKALRHQIAAVLERKQSEPDNLVLDLELAEATVRYRQLTGEGNLDRAIAATRRVQKAWPEAVEAAFGKADAMPWPGAGRRRSSSSRGSSTPDANDDGTNSSPASPATISRVPPNKSSGQSVPGKIAEMLDVRRGEDRRLLLLIGYAFAASAAYVLFSTAAYALFLAEFTAARLPLIYIVSAVAAAAFGGLYAWLEGRMPLARLIGVTLVALLISTSPCSRPWSSPVPAG